MNLNKVLLIGRLTADPQLKTIPSGQSVATFSVATNRVWTDKTGKRQEDTEFHNIVVWGRQAEIAAQFLTKGSEAFIEGRLQTRSWDDKQGVKHWRTEVVADRVQFGARPAHSTGSGQGGYAGGAAQTGGGSQFSRKPAVATPTDEGEKQSAPAEEIPIINVDEEDIKPEDLPF